MERGFDSSRIPKQGLAIALSAVAVTGAMESIDAHDSQNNTNSNEQHHVADRNPQEVGKMTLPRTVTLENVSYSYSAPGINTSKKEATYTHQGTASSHSHNSYTPKASASSSTHAHKHKFKYPHTPYGSIWDKLAKCESTNRWWLDSGNGFYGGIQFTLSSWKAVGGSGKPNKASRDEQIYRGKKLKAAQGPGAWPVCSKKVGLR
jgi:hypothetical protein